MNANTCSKSLFFAPKLREPQAERLLPLVTATLDLGLQGRSAAMGGKRPAECLAVQRPPDLLVGVLPAIVQELPELERPWAVAITLFLNGRKHVDVCLTCFRFYIAYLTSHQVMK